MEAAVAGAQYTAHLLILTHLIQDGPAVRERGGEGGVTLEVGSAEKGARGHLAQDGPAGVGEVAFC